MKEEQINASLSYLTFKLGDELFAAHVSKVINILEMLRITEVPKAPAYMKGVINLRGSVLPVIDTRIKFGMSPTVYSVNTCIIVLSIEMEEDTVLAGGLVDSVQEVLEIEAENILPSPSIGNKYKTEFITGMVKYNDQFIMILDVDKVFSADDITNLREATALNDGAIIDRKN